jgi:tRNA 5-methylaminomethyl-2-thiouridine biosynthesis bifunctional protein
MQAALEEPWSGHRVWTILDSDFGQGERFLKVCAQWRSSKQAPELLHYVAFCEPQYDVAVLGHTPAWGKAFGADDALGETAQTAPVMHPGFNRFLLQSGQISLTLCRGDIARMLSELRMQADSVFGSACAEWDPSLLCLLARNCKPGALLTHLNISANAAPNWTRNGFQLTSSDAGVVPRVETRLTAVYAPSWTVKNTRLLVTAPLKVGRCAVIGAGLGGASVAHALALRGWEVTVLDTLPQPASGASGLPAGLCVQQHSADHNPQSRLLDQGVRLSLGHARYWLKNGRDWCKSGVLERRSTNQLARPQSLQKTLGMPTRAGSNPLLWCGPG